MAWTDQCKIQAVATIKKVAEDKGIAVKKAIAEVSKEADIPEATLDRWYYPRKATSKMTQPKSTKNQKDDSYTPEEFKALHRQDQWKVLMRWGLSWGDQYEKDLSIEQFEDAENWMRVAVAIVDPIYARNRWENDPVKVAKNMGQYFPRSICWGLHTYILTRPRLPDDLWEILMKADEWLFNRMGELIDENGGKAPKFW